MSVNRASLPLLFAAAFCSAGSAHAQDAQPPPPVAPAGTVLNSPPPPPPAPTASPYQAPAPPPPPPPPSPPQTPPPPPPSSGSHGSYFVALDGAYTSLYGIPFSRGAFDAGIGTQSDFYAIYAYGTIGGGVSPTGFGLLDFVVGGLIELRPVSFVRLGGLLRLHYTMLQFGRGSDTQTFVVSPGLGVGGRIAVDVLPFDPNHDSALFLGAQVAVDLYVPDGSDSGSGGTPVMWGPEIFVGIRL